MSTPIQLPDSGNVNSACVELVYRESRGALHDLGVAYDALDTKIVGLFTISAAIVALGPRVGQLAQFPYGLSLVAWAGSAWFCFLAFHPQRLAIVPEPRSYFDDPEWFKVPVDRYYLNHAARTASAYQKNLKVYESKAENLRTAIFLAGCSVLLLGFAVLVSL